MVLYHYTTEPNMWAIVGSGILRPSRARAGSKDVRYGNGQYLSDIAPGTLALTQLARALSGMPFIWRRFTHFVAIEVSGWEVIRCRPGVFLVPGNFALSLEDRIVAYGRLDNE